MPELAPELAVTATPQAPTPGATAPAAAPAAPEAPTLSDPAAVVTTVEPDKDPAAEIEKWKALSRKNEAQAKANAEKAQKFDALEEANKTELQKLIDRAEKAEQIATQLQTEKDRAALAAKVVKDTDVPASMLHGKTEEEMRVELEQLLAFRGATAPAAPAPTAPAAGIVANADTTPANQVRQLTQADLQTMTPAQIVAANQNGQLDTLKGIRK